MNEKDLKHVIALLLEDAKRIQQIEPNSGTEARILLAHTALKDIDQNGSEKPRLNGVEIVESILENRVEASRRDLEQLRTALSGHF